MATNPIFPAVPRAYWTTLTAGTTYRDGTISSSIGFTAGGNGARIDQIKVRALGTNVGTVLRLYLNNGNATATASNNSLIHETTIALTTASDTTAQTDNDILIVKGADSVPPIPYLPPNYRIIATLGTTVSAGLQLTIHGGDY